MANHSHAHGLAETRSAMRALYAACVRSLSIAGALLTGLALAACGGGGGSTAPASHAAPSPTPPPASPQPQFIHVIIFSNGKHSTETVPNGSSPALPPGARDGGTLARANIIYPDGSVQLADANGGFDPAQSSYAKTYQRQLQSEASLQPLVVVADPAGAASPSTATVSAYSQAARAQSRQTRRAASSMRAGQSIGVQSNIAGVVLLPETTTMIGGSMLQMDAVGVDTNDQVLDLSGATIQWSAQSGTMVPFPGTPFAYYLAPDPGTGSLNDVVTVSVSLPGSTTTFTSANRVVVVSPSSTASVGGTLSANGSPAANGVALFAQAGLPRTFAPNYWLAQANANGVYTAQIPAASTFSLAMGADVNGSFDLYVAQTAGGATSYHSVAAGASDSLDLLLSEPPVQFSNLPPALQSALPSYVQFIRDGWYTTSSFYRRVFEAYSGLQPLLANQPATLPSPATPAPVGSGQLGKWCYQWQSVSSTPTLVVIENTDAQCGQPGNEAYTITPSAGSSGAPTTFQYVHYASNTPYSLAGTPDVTANALLVESGTWTQALTMQNGSIQSDQATIQADLYDQDNQVFGQPVYNESLQYQYSVGGNGLATAQFSNEQRISAWDGSLVGTFNGTKTQVATLSACQASASACHTISASAQQDGLNYTVSGTHYGDGSAALVYQSVLAGDSSKVVYSAVSDVVSNTQHCVVCSSQPGVIYDTDGTTPIATFTVNNAGLVQVLVYDTPPGSSTLGPDVVDTIGFIL